MEWANESWGSQLMSLWGHYQRSQNHKPYELEGTSGGHVVPPEKLMAIQGDSCLPSAADSLCKNGQLRWLLTSSDFALFSLKCLFSSVLFHWLCVFSAWKFWTMYSCLVRSSWLCCMKWENTVNLWLLWLVSTAGKTKLYKCFTPFSVRCLKSGIF